MEKPNDQTPIMMNRLQEREREQMLIMSFCSEIGQTLTKEELNVVIGQLKEQIFFDDFILASSNESETEYSVFCQFLQKDKDLKKYPVNDGFFDTCLDSADAVVFDLKNQNSFPEFIKKANDSGFKNGIGISLPYAKGKSNVLFMFFKSAQTFSRESNRIIRGIATQLSITIQNIALSEKYESEIAELKKLKQSSVQKEEEKETSNETDSVGIVGDSAVMKQVSELIAQVAPSQSTVLIYGETGTGKELVADAVHRLSTVSKNRIIKVNCASIPVNLIESELFGHEKGAFTGATEQRIGKFEQAQDGTIFLDEIGELPLELQGKLLRVLQEKQIERIGGKETIKVNARVIAATNRSLEKEVAEERFRSDLYYRLNVFPISLPPLRERKEDIRVLGEFFLERHSLKIGKKIKGFSKKVLNSMMVYEWPGNVRELENIIERSILFAKDELIKEIILPEIYKPKSYTTEPDFYIKTLQEVEKEHILKVVKKCNGRISGPQGAAILLGLPSTTLISRMHKLGIKKKHFLD
ncbi:Fis family transcriptional regulator [Flavobacterium crocinum]|uniref:Fis family transcriptional regulator n=1 Tax=Flavobacterium crocinum TaxID=2183896 RepID=A0A2S1YNZ4_9FLAO|nr:sigma 54-interacting transcriptional regulator [Flavobacterium crocinum]AWK05781.1 Fis family transcriptional regulator [Flavobacterium crocinum]